MNTLIVATRKGLLIYSKQNNSWKFDSLHFRGIPVCMAHHDPVTDTLWAFLDHGHWGVKMQRSKDFGKTWEEVEAMKYPDSAEVKEGVPAALKYIWSAQTDTKGRLWVGTVPGGLFMSENGGDTFELNSALWNHPHREKNWFGGGMDYPGIHSIVIDPEDSDHFFVGVSVGGVYETTDAGDTWTVRNKGLRADFMPDPHAELSHDPHLLVACASKPEYMWQQNHCGIFRSVDSGRNWEDVSEKDGPANFGFAIEVHNENPDVAWVAPGVSDEIRVAVGDSMCICRTEDGGKTWQALRKGLPQDQAFDIVYRHAMARDGDELFVGTTTGNLFRSSDGGDSWEAFSNYLPLINAVTFAVT